MRDLNLRLFINPQGITTNKGLNYLPTNEVVAKIRGYGVHVKMDGRS